MDAAGMSATAPPTAPPQSRPEPVTPLRLLKRIWRSFRTMRTALILLAVLALAASIGSFIPQRPVNELAVIRWKQTHEGVAGFAERAGLFDVYGAGWFMAIYILLLVSVVGCLVPRYRAFWRVVRARPKPGATAAVSHVGDARMAPEEALAGAERVLKKRHFRTVRSNGTLAAEKGYWREGGSIIFHTAFLLLLAGIAIGKGWGFTGQVALVEGDRFTDTHVAYDNIREGSFFNERHGGFALELNDFDVSFGPKEGGYIPKEFVSDVTLFQDDERLRRTDIKVNNPLVFRGVSIFQLDWGWAPRIIVKQNGKVLADEPVVLLRERSGSWTGVVKVPAAKPQQLGIEIFFYNDLESRQVRGEEIPVNVSPLPRRPVLFWQEYRGNLGLDRPQSVYQLDKTRLTPGDVGGILPSETAKLPGGIEVTFAELKQYSVFQLASDPGQAIVLVAAILILVGLLPALYSSRRRVWVRAIPGAEASRVEVSGLALQRRAAFEEEFSALVREMGVHLAGSAKADDG
jgi:cytochrome c biogenesis protein